MSMVKRPLNKTEDMVDAHAWSITLIFCIVFVCLTIILTSVIWVIGMKVSPETLTLWIPDISKYLAGVMTGAGVTPLTNLVLKGIKKFVSKKDD